MATRVFDFTLALTYLALLTPLLVVLAILIRVDSPGPVFYRGLRVGKDGSLFRIYKFRTMAADAPMAGPPVTTSDDPRITRVGRFLRRTKLDELPQLINVLKGEMGLVGPRPEDPAYVALYTSEQRKLLSVRPGITSPASLKYHHEEVLMTQATLEATYRGSILPDKLRIDLAYLQQRSLLTDLWVLLQTLKALF